MKQEQNHERRTGRRSYRALRHSPGTVQEVAGLIAKRCAEQQIEVDHPSTWELAAKRSWRIPAHALAPLAQAALARPRKLTREMVLEHPFPKTNPWDQEFFVR